MAVSSLCFLILFFFFAPLDSTPSNSLLSFATPSKYCTGIKRDIEKLLACVNESHVKEKGELIIDVDWSDHKQDELNNWLAEKQQIKGFSIYIVKSNLKYLKISKLEYYDHPLIISENPELETLDLRSLVYGYELIIENNPRLKKIILPKQATTTKYFINNCPYLDRDTLNGLNRAKGGECSFPANAPVNDTADLNYCKYVVGDLHFAKGATGGKIPFEIDVPGCIHMVSTKVTSLSFITVNKDDEFCDKHDNTWLCDEEADLRKKLRCVYNCGVVKMDCSMTLGLVKKPFRACLGEINPRGTGPRALDYQDDLGVAEIEGNVVLDSTRLRNVDFLKTVEIIWAEDKVPLEIINNKYLSKIEFPKLKKLNSTSAVKLKIRGNRYKMTPDKVEELKKQLNLTDKEIDIEINNPTTADDDDYLDDTTAEIDVNETMTTVSEGEDNSEDHNISANENQQINETSHENGLNGTMIGIIVGCTIGGSLLMIAGVFVAYLCFTKKKRDKSGKDNNQKQTEKISQKEKISPEGKKRVSRKDKQIDEGSIEPSLSNSQKPATDYFKV